MSRLGLAVRSEALQRRAQSGNGDTDLEVVRPPRKALRARSVIVVLLAVAVLFGLVAFQAVIVDNQSRLDDLDAQIQVANRTSSRLRLEVAELEAPDRIRSMALALGMVKPETVTYLEPISADEFGSLGDTVEGQPG